MYIYIWFIAQIGAMEQGRKPHEDSCIPFRMVTGGFLGGPLTRHLQEFSHRGWMAKKNSNNALRSRERDCATDAESTQKILAVREFCNQRVLQKVSVKPRCHLK